MKIAFCVYQQHLNGIFVGNVLDENQATSYSTQERRPLMIKLTLRYARYALSALATIGFGCTGN